MWDTAERYAHGESEATGGAWLASQPAELTGRIRIATKVAPASVEGMAGVAFDTDYVQCKLKATLERLGCRRVATYMAHALCDATPVQQTVEAFAAVIESGRAENRPLQHGTGLSVSEPWKRSGLCAGSTTAAAMGRRLLPPTRPAWSRDRCGRRGAQRTPN